MECLTQFFLDAQAHGRGIAVAGEVNQGGHEPPIGIRPEKEAGAAPFLQPLNGERRGEQSGHVDLEELIPRVGFHDGDQVFAAVRLGREARLGHDGVDFLPKNGHGLHGTRIRGVGEQANESLLSGHISISIEALDPDVIEIGRAVNAGSGICLGDHQGTPLTRHASTGLCQVLDRVSDLRGPQKAEATAVTDGQNILPVEGLQVVFPVAQKGKVTAIEPAQKFLGLREVFNFLGTRHRRECVGDQHGLHPHLLPVVDRGPNVAQNLG